MTRPASKAFSDSRLRIRWAQESLAHFEQSAKRYFQRTPIERIIDSDPDGIHEHHKIKLLKTFPSSLTKNAIATVENLRSALDLTATAVSRLAKLPAHEVHFPFCKNASDFKSRINSACKGLPKQITDLWETYEPFGTANNLVFAINELCNASKHRIIVPVANKAGINFPFIEVMGGATRPLTIFSGGEWESNKNEITYAITERELKWKHHVQIAVGICFGDVGEIAGYEVEPNLRKMIQSVTTIVDETEIECRKLGLL